MIQKLNFHSIISSERVQRHWMQNMIELHIEDVTTHTNEMVITLTYVISL